MSGYTIQSFIDEFSEMKGVTVSHKKNIISARYESNNWRYNGKDKTLRTPTKRKIVKKPKDAVNIMAGEIKALIKHESTSLEKFKKDGGSINIESGRMNFNYSGSPAAIVKIRMSDGRKTYFFNDEKIGTNQDEVKNIVLGDLGY